MENLHDDMCAGVVCPLGAVKFRSFYPTGAQSSKFWEVFVPKNMILRADALKLHYEQNTAADLRVVNDKLLAKSQDNAAMKRKASAKAAAAKVKARKAAPGRAVADLVK
jgi:hypothetical protein